MTTINTQFKDRLFTFLFGAEENRPWILSLYNAINESAYDDPGEIRINTMMMGSKPQLETRQLVAVP